MTLQNRVAPDGTILADPSRTALFMGNRGILHDAHRTLGPARWRHRTWVCCTLAFKGRKQRMMVPGSYTQLFFLDEAVALAAGHRPCAECRMRDYRRFLDHWEQAHGSRPSAPELDAALHGARARPGARHLRTWEADAADLPDGTFVAGPEGPVLLHLERALPFGLAGYGAPGSVPSGRVTVYTPEPTVRTLAAGYRPVLHPSADC